MMCHVQQLLLVQLPQHPCLQETIMRVSAAAAAASAAHAALLLLLPLLPHV
jgi:hypothetical protein